jgi:hypothetical protein
MECPICSKAFAPSEIEDHVNKCLDGGGSTAAPIEPPKPKPKIPTDLGNGTTYEVMEVEDKTKTTDEPESSTTTTTTRTTMMETDKSSEAMDEEELARLQVRTLMYLASHLQSCVSLGRGV